MLARGLFVYSSPCDITMLARAELGLFVYSSPCDNVNDMYKKWFAKMVVEGIHVSFRLMFARCRKGWEALL